MVFLHKRFASIQFHRNDGEQTMNPRHWSCSILLLVLWLIVLMELPGEMSTISLQRASSTLFQFTSSDHVLGFSSDSMYVASSDHALRIEFVNARATKPISALPSREISHTAQLTQVSYPNLWQGVTLTYDSPAVGIVRSTYRIEPDADVTQIRLRYNSPVTIELDGGLAIRYASGVLRESAPLAWQEMSNGEQVPVEAAFTHLSECEVGFETGTYDQSLPLFIDPTLTWNTFLGGTSTDQGYGIAVDGSGNVYIAGVSLATWGSPFRNYSGGNGDAFAAKLDSSGNLMWNTFLGGSEQDVGHGIAVDDGGSVYVVGYQRRYLGSSRACLHGRLRCLCRQAGCQWRSDLEHLPRRE